MDRNKVAAGLAIVIVIIIGLFIYKNSNTSSSSSLTPESDQTEVLVASSTATTSSTGSTSIKTGVSASVTDTILSQVFFNPKDPWAVLNKYVAALKDHNLDGVRELSYQISPVCADPKQSKECFSRMDTVYSLSKFIRSDEYQIKYEDAKQLILQTITIADNTAESKGYRQGILIFTKKPAGDLQVLYFNPNRGWYTNATSTSSLTPEEKLRAMMEDSDQDGVEDQVEECVNQSDDCVKTNSHKRDTNGNGWWDGVERFFYK